MFCDMMHLEDTLNEINQTQKDKYSLIHLREEHRISTFTETESRIVVAKGWGGTGMGSCCLICTEFQFVMTKKFQEVAGVIVAQHCELT